MIMSEQSSLASAADGVETANVSSMQPDVSSGIALLDAELRLQFYTPAFSQILRRLLCLHPGTEPGLGQCLQLPQLAEKLADVKPGCGLDYQLTREDQSWQVTLLDLAQGRGEPGALQPSIRYQLQLRPTSGSRREEHDFADVISLGGESEKRRLESLTSFSHEFRTPLNAVIGYAQLLQTRPEQTPEEREYVDGILTAGSHLLKLVNEILSLSQAEAESMELRLRSEGMDVSSLIVESITVVKPLARDAGVTLILDAAPVRLISDRTRLKQVILNLLSNAIRYNQTGGRIVVKTLHDGDRCSAIEVRDTGAGIASDMLDTIFTPFRTLTARRGDGRGIGLMITRRLVKLLGGQIRVASRPGRGSSFLVEFGFEEAQSGFQAQTGKRLLWIGPRTDSACFGLELLEMRPDCAVVQEEYAPVIPAEADLIIVDAAVLRQPEQLIRIRQLAEMSPRLLVLAEQSEQEQARGWSQEFSATVITAPMNAVDFLQAVDHELSQASRLAGTSASSVGNNR
jgi:signal transduction histidine kinase